jgi:hypothetical protein
VPFRRGTDIVSAIRTWEIFLKIKRTIHPIEARQLPRNLKAGKQDPIAIALLRWLDLRIGVHLRNWFEAMPPQLPYRTVVSVLLVLLLLPSVVHVLEMQYADLL